MELPSKLIEAAVDQMSSLPGVGRKTALRLVLNMLGRSEEQVEAFSEAFLHMKRGIHACNQCHNLTEMEVCSICLDPARQGNLVCIVEDIRDLLALEATGQYRGKYHVLGGVISPMDGIGPNDLNIASLAVRLETLTGSSDKVEVIFALPATMEGETTAFYIFRKLAPLAVEVTAIARGLAVGEDLQHADEATLVQSLRQRLPYTS
ncbi:MAG TPA: recombination protein RecR [Flavobacteriales bacterium]|jgi:recombination protein RecR|nr:recombination protein RecR [Flavobacteriales bacterium]